MILRMTKIVKKQHVGTFIQWRIKIMPPPPAVNTSAWFESQTHYMTDVAAMQSPPIEWHNYQEK